MAGPVLIDTHMHIYKTREEGFHEKAGGYVVWEYGTKPDVRMSHFGGNLEDALEAIEAAGFSKAVVTNLFKAGRSGGPETDSAERLKEFNRWGCDLAAPYPQLVPFVAADPTALPGSEGAAHLRDMVENQGARGIKLHPIVQAFFMGDRRMWPIYETCQELGVAVVAHSGPARGEEQYAEPRAFAEVLQAFPQLTLVFAHMGGAVWQQTREIAQTYPNAYFDCCEIIQWTGGSNAATDEQLARLIKDVGPDRVMLGTDFPWYDLDHTAERVMELPILSQEEKEGILGANAVRILGL